MDWKRRLEIIGALIVGGFGLVVLVIALMRIG
jgi:hypothetical protein